MNNLFVLIKKDLDILVGKLQGKKQRKSTYAAYASVAFGIILILALYSYQAYTMFLGLDSKLCLFHACTTLFACMTIIGLMRSSANAKYNDADLLLSMPIKKRDIVLSKTISKYFFDLFFSIMLLLPYIIIYQFKIELNIQILTCGIILTLLMPLYSIAITYIFDFFISKLFNKTRLAGMLKSIIVVLLFILVLGLLMLKTSFYGTVESGTVDSYFADRPISNLFLNFLTNTNAINILLICILTVLPFVVGCILYSFDFGKNYTTYHSKNKILKFQENTSSFSLFFKKELYNYATTTPYILNTIIGSVIILALGILIAIYGVDLIGFLTSQNILSKELIAGIIALVFCSVSSLTQISCLTISLEGKNIWLLQSTPVNLKDLFKAKSFLHFMIVEPFVLISSIIVSIALRLDLVSILIITVLPSMHVLICSFMGLFINLLFPNLNWDDETKVVKQSLSVVLSMLVATVLALVPLGIYFLMRAYAIEITFVISFVIYAILCITFSTLVFTVGKRLFYQLNK